MTVEDIYRKEKISVRSYNVCKYNDLNSIQDLKKYYFEHRTFDKLRNCGKKTNEELIEICIKALEENFSDLQAEVRTENPLKILVSNLTRVQREVINSFILVNTKGLSVRSKNAITHHLKGNLKIKNFSESILLSERFNVNDINNAGKNSIPELLKYIFSIKNFLIEVSGSYNERQLYALKNNFLIQRTFNISKIPDEILESESIFLLTDFLLNQNALFDETKTIIVKNAFKVYTNTSKKTLDDIALMVDLTRERVRQIRKVCLDDFSDNLIFIKNFNDDLFQKYNIDVNSSYIEVNPDLVDIVNTTNRTNFSKEFITYILSIYLNDRFSLVGLIEDVLQPKYFLVSRRHNWNNFYLIEKAIISKINFYGLINDIASRLSEKIEESYSFNLKSYLSKFLFHDDTEILELALPIAEDIINEEFEIYLDLEANISFEKNTIKTVPDFIVEALENLGEPSKLNVIYDWIENKYPGKTKSEEALRGSCNRSDEIIYFGRSSTFGLKKWENTRDNIKGGTIKDIITEYLEQSETPIHIVEILKEIHQYRDKTNERNVITNLKLDPNNSFIIFRQKFIGLKRKRESYNLAKYENLPIQLGKRIISLITNQNIKSKAEILNYLLVNYQLTNKESLNILKGLNLKL